MGSLRKKWFIEDFFVNSLIYLATVCVIAVLSLPIIDILVQGTGKISIEFLTETPRDSGRSGGISSIIVSTVLIMVVSLCAALPFAFATAVLLTEYLPQHSLSASIIRGSLDVLAGVPSIVFGLFGLAFFCRTLGLGYSILAGGLSLACMILPTLARSMCSALDSVGDQYRISGAALCLSRVSTLLFITLPVVLPGIMAGIILSLTRAIAETALLLFTSGYSDRMPNSVTDSGRSISVHIYELATNVPGGQSAAYGSALVLLIILMILSLALSIFGNGVHRKIVHGKK